MVYTLSENGKGVELTEFLGLMEVFKEATMDFLKVSFTNGRSLSLTGTHKIFVRDTTTVSCQLSGTVMKFLL